MPGQRKFKKKVRKSHADLIQVKKCFFLEWSGIEETLEILIQKCEHYVYCLKGSMQLRVTKTHLESSKSCEKGKQFCIMLQPTSAFLKTVLFNLPKTKQISLVRDYCLISDSSDILCTSEILLLKNAICILM